MEMKASSGKEVGSHKDKVEGTDSLDFKARVVVVMGRSKCYFQSCLKSMLKPWPS